LALSERTPVVEVMKKKNGKLVVGVLLLAVLGVSLLALAIQKATNHRKEAPKETAAMEQNSDRP